MLDLNEVHMFVHVVRARSFAAAARRLGVPSNTLSRRIKQLETELDTRLMQRSTRKLTLTRSGQLFFERCAAAVDGVVLAGKDLADVSRKPSGTVRIAAPADFLDLFHMEWVAEFLQRYPEIHLDFVLSDARADLIEEGIDVAFRGGRTLDSRTFLFEQIAEQHFNLVASPAYLQARGQPKSLSDLSAHNCLTPSSRGGTVWALHGPAGIEEVRVSGSFSATSARNLTAACLAGLGIALLPTMLIAAEIRLGRLVRILPEYRRDGADFNVLLPSRQQIPAAVSAFLEFATGHLKSMVEHDRGTAARKHSKRSRR
jgi:DNA-binding transcriptional LysR family regulator